MISFSSAADRELMRDQGTAFNRSGLSVISFTAFRWMPIQWKEMIKRLAVLENFLKYFGRRYQAAAMSGSFRLLYLNRKSDIIEVGKTAEEERIL